MPEGKPCSAELKARVALEAPQGAKAVGETAPEHGLNPSLARNREAEAEPAAREGALGPRLRPGDGFQLGRPRGASRLGPRAPEHGRRGPAGGQRDRGEATPQPRDRVREDKRARGARGAQGAHRGIRRAARRRAAAPVARPRHAGRAVLSGADGRLGGRVNGRGLTPEPRFRVQTSGPHYCSTFLICSSAEST